MMGKSPGVEDIRAACTVSLKAFAIAGALAARSVGTAKVVMPKTANPARRLCRAYGAEVVLL